MMSFRTATLALLTVLAPLGAMAHEEAGGVGPDKAWALLRDGNERFARNMSVAPHSSKERRNEVIEAQHPFAVVLGCSDSRVPAERIFDAGIGDLFTVRVAGNAASGDMVIGSIEYGVLHTGAKLVAVIGHESCGAVKAALAGEREEGSSITGMLDPVRPAAENATDALHDMKGGDSQTSEAVERNVLNSMKSLLTHSPKLAALVKEGKIKVVGGVYSLHNGRVSWLGEHPSQEEILRDKAEEGRKKK